MRHQAAVIFVALLLPLSGKAQTIRTLAGGGPNNIPATAAALAKPLGMRADIIGNLYFAAGVQNRVFKVDSTGVVTVVAGNGYRFGAFSGDGGPATSARLSSPSGVAVDSAGDVFIADTNDNVIRKVTASTGIITTVAGNGIAGFSGDGGLATSAELNSPVDVAVDSAGNVFVVDTGNNRIRRLVASTGIITTIAGNGTNGFSGDGGAATSAELSSPSDVAVDASGNILIGDLGNDRIRKVTASTGIINTVAGNGTVGFSGDGGPATSAELNFPDGFALDSAGNLFVADTLNQRVRKVTASTGIINTVAGNGTVGFSGDGGAPTSAEFSGPVGVALDSAGNLFIVDSGNNRIREVGVSTGIVATIAGNGSPSPMSTALFGGDGFGAAGAQLAFPVGVDVDSVGNVFIIDSGNERIRHVAASTGIITTVAGNGTLGFSGDGGPATSAELNFLGGGGGGVAVDSAGNVFIADEFNQRIREIAASTGIITTIAGNGTAGFSGDGGPANSAMLNHPFGVAVDSTENVFFTDTFNKRIRKVTISTGIITTVAGNGTDGFSGDGGSATSAEFGGPVGVAVDSTGNLFIADSGNQRIRKVTASTGIITTVAGNGMGAFSGDGGPAAIAELRGPGGVAVDSAGNLFIADTGNCLIRRVDAATQIITTAAGTVSGAGTGSNCGFSGDGGPASSAELNSPNGVAVDSAGNLFIADSGDDRIREVTPGPPAPAVTLAPDPVSFANQAIGTRSAAQTVILTNSGTADLSITGIAINGANGADFAQTNTCGTLPATLAPSTSCNVHIAFTPSTTAAESASLAATDTASDSPQSLPLAGTGTDFSVAVASSSSSSATVTAGQSAAYTINLSPLDGFNQMVNLSCTGAPSGAMCTPSPASATLDGTNSQNVTVAVTTTARGMLPPTTRPPNSPWSPVELLLLTYVAALMIAFGFTNTRRLRPQAAFALLGLCVISLGGLVACGGGGSSAAPPPTGTPAGTYTLSITGTSGSLSHKTTLMLTVN